MAFETDDPEMVVCPNPAGGIETVIDELISMAKKHGDVLPFFTPQRLKFFCSHLTTVGPPMVMPIPD